MYIYIYIHTMHVCIYVYIHTLYIYICKYISYVMYVNVALNDFECNIYHIWYIMLWFMHVSIHHFVVISPQENPFAFWSVWFWRNTCLRDLIFMKFWKLCVALICGQIWMYSDGIDTGTRQVPFQNFKLKYGTDGIAREGSKTNNNSLTTHLFEVCWCVVL